MHKSTYLLGKLSLWGDISRSTMSSKVSRKVKRDKMWSINSLAARLNSINTNFIYQQINKYSRKDELSHIASAVPKHTNQSLLTSKNKKKTIFKQSRHFHIIQKMLFI